MTLFLVTVLAREAEKIDHDLDKKIEEDPAFKKEVEENIMELNKKFGVAEGDMHGIEDDLDMGWDDEKISPDYNAEEFKKQMEEEMKKINAEYGLDADEMHGLDDETLDYQMQGGEDDVPVMGGPGEAAYHDDIKKQTAEYYDNEMAKLRKEDPKLAKQLLIDGEEHMEHSEGEDLGTADDQDEEYDDDWAYDNEMYEGVDGLEEFEPDLSELSEGDDPNVPRSEDDIDGIDEEIEDWDWEDEEEDPEDVFEREEEAGWEENKGALYSENEIMLIVIFGVAMTLIVCGIVWYFFCVSDDPPVDAKTGRKLTRK